MSGPPIPPRRKRAPGSSKTHDYSDEDYSQGGYQYDYEAQASTSGRFKHSTSYDYDEESSAVAPRGGSELLLRNILDESPETTIGKNVKVKGELAFEKLLRVDGSFEGRLLSKGDLVIGKTGSVMGDIVDMGVVVNDGGKIIGNLSVERLELRGKASVHGNITCKSLKIDPTTVIVGSINVNPFAPSKVDPAGNIMEETERMKAPVNTNIPMPDNNNKASGAMSPDGGGSEKKSKKKGGDAVQA